MKSGLRLAACAMFAMEGSLASTAQEAPASGNIVVQANRCMRLPGVLSYGSYRAVVIATFENGVASAVRATDLDPSGEAGRSLLEAATRALERCGPYPYAEDGEHRLSFESEE